MELLAPDVTVWTDGGGKVRPARRPIHGAEKVAAWLLGVARRPYQGFEFAELTIRPAEINGTPGLFIAGAGRVIATLTLDLDDDGRIVAVHSVVNPDKLEALTAGRVHPVGA
jgi:RNA polymerase sigma-70 factor (ECF subfamily)